MKLNISFSHLKLNCFLHFKMIIILILNQKKKYVQIKILLNDDVF